VIHGAIFMLVVSDVLDICRLWVVVSDTSYVFLQADLWASSGLTYIRQFPGVAC